MTSYSGQYCDTHLQVAKRKKESCRHTFYRQFSKKMTTRYMPSVSLVGREQANRIPEARVAIANRELRRRGTGVQAGG